MALDLFAAPLDTVTATDVIDFLSRVEVNEEGPRLEYKAADSSGGIPHDTALKVIIAFANTYGGVLILGVEANRTTNRPVRWEGVQLTKGLEETVTAMCSSSIFPPVIPEVHVYPLKSDPALSTDDKAFVIVRVAPSLAAPHADKENRFFVRVNSQCRLADLPTLKFLLNRQQQHAEMAAQLVKAVRERGASIRQRFRPELDTHLQQRWRPGSHRIYFELIPLDSPTDLLSFDYNENARAPRDQHIIHRFSERGWFVRADKPDDILPEPEGLGLVATYGSRPFEEEQLNTMAVSTLYIDRSGGLFVDLSTASLGGTVPGAVPNNPSTVAAQLLLRLESAMRAELELVREHKYAGRMQATTWVDLGNGSPPQLDPTKTHRGSTIFSVLDSLEDQKRGIGRMVSQMTRSWLRYTFSIRNWPGGSGGPDLESSDVIV
jgi:schlafen family protein